MKNSLRWDNLTSPELKKLSEQGAIVLLPVGSIEQHGPHLPVGCDSLVATAMSEYVAKELTGRGKPCVVAPSITVGNSVHHMSFSGSMTLSPDTYMRVLTDYCKSIAAHGFKKIVVVNGHGGNSPHTNSVIVTINEALGFPVFFANYWQTDDTSLTSVWETQKGIIHACEAETSIMLAIDETLVDPIYKETKGYPDGCHSAEDRGIVSTFHRMESHTANGVMGNSYAATKEKGEKAIKCFVNTITDVLADDTLWAVRV